jgi:hypothetical protein
VELERREIGRGEYRYHARQRLRLRRVDVLDARMSIGRADQIAVQHARQLQVVHIIAATLSEAHILHALAAAAHALQFFAPLGGGGFGNVVHSAASLIAPPRSFAAAY